MKKRINIDGKFYTLTPRDGRIEVRSREIQAVLPPKITLDTPNLKVIVKASVTMQKLKKQFERA